MNFRIKEQYLIILLLVVFVACGKEKNNYSEAEIEKTSAELNQYFEKEFQKDIDDSPMLQTRLGYKSDYGKWDDLSHLKYAEDLKKAKKRLEYLKTVDVEALNEESRLSYRLYKQQIENEIADYDYRFYNYPVNQMHGYQSELPAFLINMHRIDSVSDARDYISRLEGFPGVIEDIKGNIKIREQNGIVPPKFVFDKVLEDSKNIIKGKPFGKASERSVLLEDFYTKVQALDISEEEKRKLISDAEQALINKVKPAYENLIATLENQQKRATIEDGAWKFPKGIEFYNNALKRFTTTNLTAEEIHEMGKSEVARIHRHHQ